MDLAGAEWEMNQIPIVKFGWRQIFKNPIVLGMVNLAWDFDC